MAKLTFRRLCAMNATVPPADSSVAQQGRRSPVQQRSRVRVEAILDAAATLVLEVGVEGLGTRAIAEATGFPVATIYQYFADKDAILLALVERDTAEMDERLAQQVAELDELSLHGMVQAALRAFTAVCRERPSFVMIWTRGRINATVANYTREHNKRIAKTLFELATASGLVRPDADLLTAEMAVEFGDRIIELAFAKDLNGDDAVLRTGGELLTGALAQYEADAPE